MSEQLELVGATHQKSESVDEFRFDELPPIKGFPRLQWHGKRPFTSTHFYPAQKRETYGNPVSGWMNKIYWGDNLQVMSHLLKDYRGRIPLIYIDPPFDSRADYKKRITVKGTSVSGDMSSFEEKQYTDIWNNDSYLQYIYERLILCRELLSEAGSIYVHCDYQRSHMIKLIMDEIFGPDMLRNEIVWKRTAARSDSKTFNHVHDCIFFYTKSDKFTWNPQYTKHSDEYIKSKYNNIDDSGKRYMLDNMTSPNPRPNMMYEWKGFPSPENGWRYSQETMAKLDAEGRIYYPDDKTKRPRLKRYLEDSEGRPLDSVWTDVYPVNSQAADRLGYPTQKPEELIERFVRSSSNPGDIVLDVFMGSATTQAVAMKLGRRFLGADINLGSIETAVTRLNAIREEIDAQLPTDDAAIFTGFEVSNVNNYDIFRNPVEAKEILREALEVQPLANLSVFDGVKDDFLVKIMPVNRIATRSDVNDLIAGMDFKQYEKRREESPGKPVEKILLVCMGHEPDLAAALIQEAKPYLIEVKVVDILRDRDDIQFKRSAEAKVVIRDSKLVISKFYPLNLMQKLSYQEDNVEDWRQLVDSIKIDWNYDGAVLEPVLIDMPGGESLVSGVYDVPKDAGTVRVKITDLLSESLELTVNAEE
ncbi:MAG: site-specific DNA-methyltransferase [Solirubrobacterales bacterium]